MLYATAVLAVLSLAAVVALILRLSERRIQKRIEDRLHLRRRLGSL